MLKTLRNAWKIKEIRTKLIFTFLMLVVIRFGSELPIPGVKTDFFANFFANQSTDDRWILLLHVYFRTEHHPVHYIFYYHAAAHDRNSEAGRDAA